MVGRHWWVCLLSEKNKIRAGDPISVRLEPAHPFMVAWWLLESLVVFLRHINMYVL